MSQTPCGRESRCNIIHFWVNNYDIPFALAYLTRVFAWYI